MPNLAEFAITAFTTLFIAFGPLETAPIFGGLTPGLARRQRFAIAFKAVAVAGVVLLAFSLFGLALLDALHISLDAFRVAGGILLLLQSIDLIFAHPTGLSSITPTEESEAKTLPDIAVFPLAFPLIAGPASMTAVVLLMGQAQGDLLLRGAVLAALIACLLITYLALIFTDLLHKVLRTTGSNVVARLSGVILAALAVQFIFDGLKGSRLFG